MAWRGAGWNPLRRRDLASGQARFGAVFKVAAWVRRACRDLVAHVYTLANMIREGAATATRSPLGCSQCPRCCYCELASDPSKLSSVCQDAVPARGTMRPLGNSRPLDRCDEAGGLAAWRAAETRDRLTSAAAFAMGRVAERHRLVAGEPHEVHLSPASSRPSALAAFGAVVPRYRVMRCLIPSAVGQAVELRQTPLETTVSRSSTRHGTLRRGPGSVNQSQGPGGAQRQ